MAQTDPTLCVDVDGPAIRRARQEAGLTVRVVAEQVGIGPAFLYHLEVGTRPRLSIAKFKVLAETLGVDRTELVAKDAA